MLKLNDNKNVIVSIKDKNNKSISKLSAHSDYQDIKELELTEGYKFQLLPRDIKEKERSCLFVAGQSGAGKSYFILQYSKEYKKMFPKNPIYLISYLEQDETLDSYKPIERLDVFNSDVLEELETLKIEDEFRDCLVIFDDIDCIEQKKMKIKIYGMLNKLLRIGRHYNTSIAYLGHELYASPEIKTILNESHSITFFPLHLNYKKLKYLLENYLGFSKEQIECIKNMKSRAITILKGHPMVVLSETKICILENDFDK